MATMNDVAKEAGVSASTVSRVLNKTPQVTISAETRAKVLKAAKRLNYRPNRIAQSLRLKKYNSIGFLLCERSLDQMYYYNLLKAVEQEASRSGLSLIFAINDEKVPPMLNDTNIDGLLVAGRVTRDRISIIEKLGVPYIVLGIVADDQHKGNIVASDPEADIYIAVEYLLKLGHTKIAYINSHPDPQLHDLIIKGYKKAYTQADIPVDMQYLVTGVKDPYPFLKKYLIEQKVTALVIQQLFVKEFYQFIAEHNISIPNDLSVIIIGEDLLDPQARSFYHYISSRTKDVGTIAVEQLRRIWDKEISYVNMKISPLLHEGRSVLQLTETLSREA